MKLAFCFALISVLLLSLTSCGSTGPSEPDFLFTSLEFTGDSTGEEPICQFTLMWEYPVPDTRFEYTVFRSLVPSIQSDPEEAEALATLLTRNWIDSENIDWGTVYYYAVRAIPAEGSTRWSDEISVQSPDSPYPEPVVLDFEKVNFTFCRLIWTEYMEDDFAAYHVLRSYLPDIEKNPSYMHDTLFTTSDRATLTFTDTTLTAPPGYFYTVVTVDSTGLGSYSNVVEFLPGGDIPWRVTRIVSTNPYSDSHFHISYISQDQSYFLTSVDNYGAKYIEKRRSSDGEWLGALDCQERCSAELLNGKIVVSTDDWSSEKLTVYSPSLSELTAVSVSFPILALIDTPEGILASCQNERILFDRETLDILQIIPIPSFSRGTLSPDGNRLYLTSWNGIVTGYSLPDFSTFGETGSGFNDAYIDSDGNLCCAGDFGTAVYNGATLELIDQYDFPSDITPLQGVSFLKPGGGYVYGWDYQDAPGGGSFIIYVLDSEEKELAGTIAVEGEDIYGPERFHSSPDGSFLWFSRQCYDSNQTVYVRLGI